MHENYVNGVFYNDIMIIEVSSGFGNWSDRIRPICMPSVPADDVAGEMGIVSGWGVTETGE